MAYRKAGDSLTIDEILTKIKYAGKKQPVNPVTPVYAATDINAAKKVLDRIKKVTTSTLKVAAI